MVLWFYAGGMQRQIIFPEELALCWWKLEPDTSTDYGRAVVRPN